MPNKAKCGTGGNAALAQAMAGKEKSMLYTTRTAAAAIFAADPTMTDAERKARLAPDFAPTNPEPYDEILTPATAAKILGGRDRHTLAAWVRRGLLRAVRTGKDGKRITGFTSSSVRDFLAGKTMNGNEVTA